MSVIEKINWDSADLDKVIGDYIKMPDGSDRYIEMPLGCWSWVRFMNEHGVDIGRSVITPVLEMIEAAPGVGTFEEFFPIGVMHWRTGYLQSIGKMPKDPPAS